MPKFQIFGPKVTEKLCELMLYIAKESEQDRSFGAVKLNKLLYYTDLEAYRRLGKTITGVEYKHLREGPVPPADKARAKLIQEGRAKVEYVPTPKKDQERLVALASANVAVFTKDELKIIQEIIKKYWRFTGSDLSAKSHKEYGYKLTKEGETIPSELGLISAEPPTRKQIEVGQAIAKKRGLAV